MDARNSQIFNIQIEEEAPISFEIDVMEKIERELADNLERLENLDKEIGRLTNKADKIDYWVSIASGLITGLIDIFFVGELKFDPINGINEKDSIAGNAIINSWVKKVAKFTGYNGPDDLQKNISHLENNFHIDCDDAYRQHEKWISSHTLHHLEDMCHHPTPAGFIAALCLSFLRIAFFSDGKGKTTIIRICTGREDTNKTVLYWSSLIVSGLLYWMSCALCRKYTNRELSELPKWQRILIKLGTSIPVLGVLVNIAFKWMGHLISDMAGSKSTAGGGMGIPGLFLSLMKEMSMIPPFNMTQLPSLIQNLYSKKRIDFRDELIPVAKHLGKQSLPVILNEVIISTFYFVRRLICEYRKTGGWKSVDWSCVIPFCNRTIVRMRTISSGVFTALDILGATIETAVKGEGVDIATFLLRIALKINIVGIGKFAIDLGKDTSMGLRRSKMKNLRSKVMMERIYLMSAKIYIQKNNIWEDAKNVDKALESLFISSEKALTLVCNNWKAVIQDFQDVQNQINERCNEDEFFNEAIDLYL